MQSLKTIEEKLDNILQAHKDWEMYRASLIRLCDGRMPDCRVTNNSETTIKLQERGIRVELDSDLNYRIYCQTELRFTGTIGEVCEWKNFVYQAEWMFDNADLNPDWETYRASLKRLCARRKHCRVTKDLETTIELQERGIKVELDSDLYYGIYRGLELRFHGTIGRQFNWESFVLKAEWMFDNVLLTT